MFIGTLKELGTNLMNMKSEIKAFAELFTAPDFNKKCGRLIKSEAVDIKKPAISPRHP